MDLKHKIIRTALRKEHFQEAGRRLGVLREGILVFRNEDETSVLMDFALNDLKTDDKTVVQMYQERIGEIKDVERGILNALISSYTSLFRIDSISASDSILFLTDLLNDKTDIRLVDICFSQSAIPGLLLFMRLVPFKSAFMTSGISFIFRPDLENTLLRKYKELSKRVDMIREPAERFPFFFKENEIKGMDVRYE
jgi:hypothetical protein